ncbi:DUF6397 family protein [Streptomyces himalayensis]|uniref:DUF6397 family protein n=1 Tax=Streptomyces himalayensis TaxID=2820085 RepID=UPI001C6A23E5|nr:DUF6397 family protein [Streptomyces himalayensis]
MTGNTLTTASGAQGPAHSDRPSVAQSRAARELGLKRSGFDLAVLLGRIRTVPDEAGGRRRVTVEELERVRTAEGFPDSLRQQIRVVGTTEGAELMGISSARFTKLARLGLLVPVRFYLNRYRAVVWLYLAQELQQFAGEEANAPLLGGRVSTALREQLAEGVDVRARNWRGRYTGLLLRRTEDTWERAAVVASLLDPVQVAEIVPDPYERSYLNRLRPQAPGHGAPDSPAAQLTERIMTADDPDEILWVRANLSLALAEAREDRPAPRPASGGGIPVPRAPEQRASPACEALADLPDAKQSRGLLRWMRRRRADDS